MKIVNNTNLCYAELGLIIDNIIKHGKEDTIYYGKIDSTIIEFGSNKIIITIRYLKRYVEWRFNYLK